MPTIVDLAISFDKDERIESDDVVQDHEEDEDEELSNNDIEWNYEQPFDDQIVWESVDGDIV